MSCIRSLFGLLALIGGLAVATSVPASAEFFHCKQRPGQVLYSYTGTPDQYVRRQHRSSAPRYSASSSRYYSAKSQRRHTTRYSGTRYWNGR